jgi:hypothetical protein
VPRAAIGVALQGLLWLVGGTGVGDEQRNLVQFTRATDQIELRVLTEQGLARTKSTV